MLAVDKLKRILVSLLRHSRSSQHSVTSPPHAKDSQGHSGGYSMLKAPHRRMSLIESYPSSVNYPDTAISYPTSSCLVPINVCPVTSQSRDDVVITPTIQRRRVTSFEQQHTNTSTTWNYFDAADAYNGGGAVNVNGVCFSVYGTLPRNLVRRKHTRQAQEGPGQSQGHSKVVQGQELWSEGQRRPAPSPPRRTNSIKTTTDVQQPATTDLQRLSENNDLQATLTRRRTGLTPAENRTNAGNIMTKQTVRSTNTTHPRGASGSIDLDLTLTRQCRGLTTADIRANDDNIMRVPTMRSTNTVDAEGASYNTDLDLTLTRRSRGPFEPKDRQVYSNENVLCPINGRDKCGWFSDDDDHHAVSIPTHITHHRKQNFTCRSGYPTTSDSSERYSPPPPYDDTIKRRIATYYTIARARRDNCNTGKHVSETTDSQATGRRAASYRDDTIKHLSTSTITDSVAASNGQEHHSVSISRIQQCGKMAPPSSSSHPGGSLADTSSSQEERPNREKGRCFALERGLTTVTNSLVTADTGHERSNGGERIITVTKKQENSASDVVVDDRFENGTVKRRSGTGSQKLAGSSSPDEQSTRTEKQQHLAVVAGAVSNDDVMPRLDSQEFDVKTKHVTDSTRPSVKHRLQLTHDKRNLHLTDVVLPAVASGNDDVFGGLDQEFDVDVATVVRRRSKSSAADVSCSRFTNFLTTDADLWSIIVFVLILIRCLLSSPVSSPTLYCVSLRLPIANVSVLGL